MTYYEATNHYPEHGLTAPWYFRTTGGSVKPDDTTDIDVEFGYGDRVLTETVNVPGAVNTEDYISVIGANNAAYAAPVGPTDGPSFPVL